MERINHSHPCRLCGQPVHVQLDPGQHFEMFSKLANVLVHDRCRNLGNQQRVSQETIAKVCSTLLRLPPARREAMLPELRQRLNEATRWYMRSTAGLLQVQPLPWCDAIPMAMVENPGNVGLLLNALAKSIRSGKLNLNAFPAAAGEPHYKPDKEGTLGTTSVAADLI